jgi:hypothetical protein
MNLRGADPRCRTRFQIPMRMAVSNDASEEPGHFYFNNHLFDGMDIGRLPAVRHFQRN